MLLQSPDAFEEPAGVAGECVTLDENVSATTVRRHRAALGIPAAKHVEAIAQELKSMATDIKDEISDIRELTDNDRPIPEGWSIRPLEFRVESLKEVTRRFMKGESQEGTRSYRRVERIEPRWLRRFTLRPTTPP